jgi:hypothetical protein
MSKLFIQNNLNLNEQQIGHLKEGIKFCKEKLNIQGDINVYLVSKNNNLGITTGGYDPNTKKIYSMAENRILNDILKTISHEAVHQRQDEMGKLVGDIPDIGGIIEDTANALAGRLVKMYVKEKNAREIYSI